VTPKATVMGRRGGRIITLPFDDCILCIESCAGYIHQTGNEIKRPANTRSNCRRGDGERRASGRDPMGCRSREKWKTEIGRDKGRYIGARVEGRVGGDEANGRWKIRRPRFEGKGGHMGVTSLQG